MPATSPPLPVLPQTSTLLTTPTASQVLMTRTSPSLTPLSMSLSSTPLTATPPGTIDASSVTLTGAAADLNTAYTANDNGSISGLSNEDVTLSDTTLDVSILNTLDGNTAGTINASSITTLTGAAC